MSVPRCIVENKITFSDPQEIAEKFNNYFSSIADSILRERNHEGKSHLKISFLIQIQTPLSLILLIRLKFNP